MVITVQSMVVCGWGALMTVSASGVKRISIFFHAKQVYYCRIFKVYCSLCLSYLKNICHKIEHLQNDTVFNTNHQALN